MVENKEAITQEKIYRTEFRCGCFFVCFFFIALITCPFLYYGVLRVKNEIEVYNHQNKWDDHRLENYAFEIGSVGLDEDGTFKVTVCKGHISKIEDVRCLQSSTSSQSCEAELPSLYRDNPIDAMFSLAKTCIVFCSTEYDKEYGYPTSVGGMFLEGRWDKITNFQEIDCQ